MTKKLKLIKVKIQSLIEDLKNISEKENTDEIKIELNNLFLSLSYEQDRFYGTICNG